MIVLPDTQFYSQSYPQTFNAQTQWIVDNLASRNIAFAVQLGDIVQSGESGSDRNATQWQRADSAMDRLDGNLAANPDGLVPYAALLGNHDYRVVSDKTSGTTRYQEYFGPSRYQGRSWYLESSAQPGGHVQIFSAGGYRFLNINLQFEPLDADIAWAQSVIDDNPGLPTIVTTHSYLNPTTRRRQSTMQGAAGSVVNPGNTGEQVFQKLIYPNPQVFLVMNGHFTGEFNQISTNRAGQDVFEIVVDYQGRQNGGDGWLRIMEFQPENNRIEVSTYSPTRNEFEVDSNSRFTLPIDFTARFGAPVPEQAEVSQFQNGRVVGGTIYNGTVDTQLRQAFPGTVYGTSTSSLLVDAAESGANDAGHALLQFSNIFGTGANRIPANATILSAQLVVESVNPGAGGTLHRMLSPWTNNSTWNSLSAGVQADNFEAASQSNAQLGSSALTPIVPVDSSLAIDVARDVQAWADGAANYGWAFLPWPNGVDGWAFSPSEAANIDERPSLRIEWLPPVVGNLPPTVVGDSGILNFVENAPAIAIFPNATVADTDSPNFVTGRLEVSVGTNSDRDDRIEIRHQGNAAGQIGVQGNDVTFGGVVIGSFGGGFGIAPLSIDLLAAATVEATQALFRNIVYSNVSDTPNTSVKTLRARLFDGDGNASGLLSRNVVVTPFNDGPVFEGLGDRLEYAAGGSYIALAPTAALRDLDSSTFNGGSLSISLSGGTDPSDMLFVRQVGNGAGQVNVVGNSITVGGVNVGTRSGGSAGTPLLIQWSNGITAEPASSVLRALAFSTSGTRLAPPPRTVTIQANDGQGGIGQSTIALTQSQVRRRAFQQGVDFGYGAYGGAVDMQLLQSSPTTAFPFGNNANEGLLIDYDPGTANSQALLRFDSLVGTGPNQIPLGSKIVSARLVLNTTNPGDGAGLYRMLTGWNGQTETWNSFGNAVAPRNATPGVQPNGSEASTEYAAQVGTASGNGDTTNGPTVIGVWADVQAWVDGVANHGWLVNAWNGQTNGWAFSASEAGDPSIRPRLEVEWLPSTIPSVGFRQGENGYSGTVDTQLQQDNPTRDYSATVGLFSDYNSPDPNNDALVLADQSQVLLRFDQIIGSQDGRIPSGALVHAAAVTLVGNISDAPGDGGRIFAMQRDWQAGSTWNSLSNGIANDGIEAALLPTAVAGSPTQSPGVEGGWNRFDVTQDVRAWAVGSSVNRGWAVLPWEGGTNGWGIQSSETSIVGERPQLQVFYTPVGSTVSPTGGLTTTEAGGTASFSIVLHTPPIDDVVINLTSSDPSEGIPSVNQIVFTPSNWDIPQTVVVVGVNDTAADGNVAYQISTNAVSSDPNYQGLAVSDVALSNLDDDPPTPAPKIESIEFGDGTSQRSMITNIRIAFDSNVAVAAGAFILEQGGSGGFAPIPTSDLTIHVDFSLVGGKTIAALTFSSPTPSTFVIGGSLPDGNYRLTLVANLITAAGLNLDGDGNGSAGDNYVRGNEETDNFFRLYGDTDGNRVVSLSELGQLRASINKPAPDIGYDRRFDFNQDGVVSLSELGRLRSRINRRLNF